MRIRTRFAPSPTGFVHIGSLRTALYNYLYAKKNDGDYLLRIEDTDRTRLVEGAIEDMIQAMDWAGIHHSEGPEIVNGELTEVGEYGPYTQSMRTEIYRKHVEELIEKGHAYRCFCSKERLDEVREKQRANNETPMYDGHCRDLTDEEINQKLQNGESYVVRLKLPEDRDIYFKDAIKGDITINTKEIDDQVLLKEDGFPTYHLAVIVDDHYMKISHVVRGEEWLTSTPKHIYTYEAFGWEAPTFVHLPVILNDQKKKLSKRQGDVAVEDFIKKGYLPEALVNYVALVGWSPDGDQEILSMEEMIEQFSFEKVSKSGGVFDVNKLNWVNNHYIKEYDLDQLTKLAKPFLIEYGYVTEEAFEEQYDLMKVIVDVLRERLNNLSELEAYQHLFFGSKVELEDDQAKEMIALEHVPNLLPELIKAIENVENWEASEIKKSFKGVQKETGIKGKNLFMPIRVSVTGQVHGPDIAKIIEILGRENTIERIKTFI